MRPLLEVKPCVNAQLMHTGGRFFTHAKELLHRQFFDKLVDQPGVMRNKPLGLRWSEAILARNLLMLMPADAVNPVTSKICCLISLASNVADGLFFLLMVTSRKVYR